MDINEFEVEFKSELEQGLDHAEWYQDQIKWMIKRIRQLERANKKLKIGKYPKGDKWQSNANA